MRKPADENEKPIGRDFNMKNIINALAILEKYRDCTEIQTNMIEASEKEIFKMFKFTRNYPYDDIEIQIDNLPQGKLNNYEHKHIKMLLHGINRYYKTWVNTDNAENIWKSDRDNYFSTIKDWIDKDVQRAEMEEAVENEVQRRMKEKGL